MMQPSTRIVCARREGVTLVEVVTAAALSVVLLAGVMTVLVMGRRMGRLQETRVEERRRLRLAVEEMAQTLRGASSVFVVRSDEGLRLTATRGKGRPVIYIWETGGDLWRRTEKKRRRIAGPFQDVAVDVERPFCSVRLSTDNESIGFLVMPRLWRLETIP